MNTRLITLRTIFESDDVFRLLEEPEFAHNTSLHAARDIKPFSDHFLAIFVFEAESQYDGSLLLRAISTTVVGIQRYTTKRLQHQGIYVATNPDEHPILPGTLRAHFHAREEDLRERLNSIWGPKLRWTKEFPNGAGDLASPTEFVISDPDLTALEKLFSVPDPRPQENNPDEEN
jgi:hypothetical protein